MPSQVCTLQERHARVDLLSNQLDVPDQQHHLYPSSEAIAFRGLLPPSRSPSVKKTTSPRNKEIIQIQKQLGTGGFGTVYLASWNSEKLALKILHRKRRNSSAMLESIKAECRVLDFDHPNVVKTWTVHSCANTLGSGLILMEFVGYRNLQDVINNTADSLGFGRRVKFALHISKALEYIHSNRVVHLDLKPSNVIVTSDDVCKLGDFGCSQHLEQPVSYMQRSVLTGTVAYVAPELFRGALPTVKSDVYSFGITLWQMLWREIPYGQENQHVVIFRVVAYNLRPRESSQTNNAEDNCYQHLYKQCWDANPHQRPAFDHLVQVFQIWLGS